MGFKGEFASYEPLRRLFESEKVKELQKRYKLREKSPGFNSVDYKLIDKDSLNAEGPYPEFVIAIDGSHLAAKVENGFPGAEIGYVTISSVLIDLNKLDSFEDHDFIDPKEFRETEKPATIETVFPGCNIILDDCKDAKASLRKGLFEELNSNRFFKEGETLLETYEYLFDIKQKQFSDSSLPKSPIEKAKEYDMTYGFGTYSCPLTGDELYSTDALRLHELMNQGGSNGEMFGQIMSTIEKLWLIHMLRGFEKKGWLNTLSRVAFVMDGPLAVFSTSSWLNKVISYEIERLNNLQKKQNGSDLIIFGIEKSGTFVNHFDEIDINTEGVNDEFPHRTALLLDDQYIKKNIIFSESQKPYGQDTYFGRKLFYKTSSGQKLVPIIASYSKNQADISTCNPSQFARLRDILDLLDKLVSNRYPNSISPLISAHAEAAIPLNLGMRLFEDIAKEIRKGTE